MKLSNISFFRFTTTFAFLFFLASCKKDATSTPAGVGHFYLHIHTYVNATKIDTTFPVATDAIGRQIKLNVAQFYVSAIRVMKSSGQFYDMSGAILLKTIGNEQFYVGDLPAGDYTSVSFNVGLGDPVNSTDPALYPASSILAPQTPAMWFGSTFQGYIFMNIQGLADTSATNTGPVNFPFSYQMGRPSEMYGVNLPTQNFSISAGQIYSTNIRCDFGKLLQGLNFKTQYSANPFISPANAAQIAQGFSSMFRYE
jgi:hypothetical protein